MQQHKLITSDRWRVHFIAQNSMISAMLAGLMACGGGGDNLAPVPVPAPPTETCSSWPTLYQPEYRGQSALQSVVRLSDCSVIVAGYEGSTAQSQAEGNSNAFVERLTLDTQGAVQRVWRYVLDTTGTDQINQLLLDNNQILFVGASSGALPGQVNQGKQDVLIGRLSVDGSLIGVSQLGTERPNVPVKLFKLAPEQYLLVGYDDYFIPTNYLEAKENPWLARLDEHSQGQFQVQWWQTDDTPQGDFYTSAAMDSDLYVGYQSDMGESRGAWLKKLTTNGDPYWSVSLSNSPIDTIAGTQVVNEEVWLMGTSYLALDQNYQGRGDLFLAKMSPTSGDLISVEMFGSAALDWARLLIPYQGKWLVLAETGLDEALTEWEVSLYQHDGQFWQSESLQIGKKTLVSSADVVAEQLLTVGYWVDEQGRAKAYMAGFSL
ncbi:hypothetical protein KJY73_17700 [Bowmanella sp. Y26]|uniref:hypothetical protein n=1 Tax=Bowmanella yangjiangensis TaxID=2811230 RepID=UPI001BDD5E1A|nr:hypothetical protein [Bowmanella yangjiangensis]MBT1065426.1 hypothetical protein [Bowmanella yangjiangensis]